MSRCVLLINRGAGASQRGYDPAVVARDVEQRFREAGHEISTTLVGPGELAAALRTALAGCPDTLIIGGGDGSVAAAAGMLAGGSTALAVLPMGTFNLAARDFGVPLDFTEAAAFLATAPSFPIDVLDVNGRACLCSTILGFYPEFSGMFEDRESHGGRWWRKTIGVLAGLRTAFVRSRPLRLQWETPDGRGEVRTKFSAFVPGRYRSEAGLMPSRTDFTSGTLTAYLGRYRRPTEALRGIMDYAVGRQEETPGLEVIATPEMVLRSSRRRHCKVMMDGEILRLDFPIRLRILPGALRVHGDPAMVEDSDTGSR